MPESVVQGRAAVVASCGERRVRVVAQQQFERRDRMVGAAGQMQRQLAVDLAGRLDGRREVTQQLSHHVKRGPVLEGHVQRERSRVVRLPSRGRTGVE